MNVHIYIYIHYRSLFNYIFCLSPGWKEEACALTANALEIYRDCETRREKQENKTDKEIERVNGKDKRETDEI